MLFKLKLPVALPFIFAGLKTSAVLAVIGAIVGEFLGAAGGLGQLIRVAGSQLEIARLFAYVILLGIMGGALFQIIAALETKIVFWRDPEPTHSTAERI
jgi:NitT/TauT family transport system permease protein